MYGQPMYGQPMYDQGQYQQAPSRRFGGGGVGMPLALGVGGGLVGGLLGAELLDDFGNNQYDDGYQAGMYTTREWELMYRV